MKNMEKIMGDKQDASWNPSDIVLRIVGILENALKENNSQLWTDTIYSEDDIANEAQKIWFDGYIKRHNPKNIEVKVLKIIEGEKILVDCSLKLEYNKFDPVTEIHRYTIEYMDKFEDWRITWLEKIPSPFMSNYKDIKIPFDFRLERPVFEKKWWEDKVMVSLAKSATDPLSSLVYARAVPRNVRFREAHPLLECAALLVNMMSVNVTKLALQVFSQDKLKLLSNLYNASMGKIYVRLVRQDRDNSWASKFLAPWYGFDEMLNLKSQDETISGNCSPVMSFYFAILCLGGVNFGDLYQIRMNNQDAILMSSGSKFFLLSSDKIIHLTDKTLYHNKNVTKFYNERWIWTSLGVTNINENLRKRYGESFIKNVPVLQFPVETRKGGPECIGEPEENIPSLMDIKDPIVLSNKIKLYVLNASNKYPDSSYTWAKYGFQTLYVPKPETYILWSLQSPLMQEFIKECTDFFKLLEVIKTYEKESIFIEDHRIMTADQVVRHKKGDLKSLALLMYTWFVLREKKEALLIITKTCYYCSWLCENEWKYWDCGKEVMVSKIEGEIILAMDNKYSYYPLVKGEEINQPDISWLNLIKGGMKY